MASVWVYAEIDHGEVSPVALEILTKARELGDVSAVCLGPGATDQATKLGEYGAQTVYASDDEVYSDYLTQPRAHALAELVSQHSPNMILFAMDYESRDIAGRLAAKTGSTVMANATDITAVDKAQTQIFGGNKIVDVTLGGNDPKLVLVRPKSFEPQASGGQANVQPVEVQIPDELKKAKRVARHEEEAAGVKLEEATVIFSGGRGLTAPEKFELLDELSGLVKNAAVGATRAVVDAGWVPYSYQIGQTGKTVKPEVYIAAGISGASQHQVGMKESKVIISINKDADAPIFQISDLGIVGDTMKVLPALIEELQKRKG